MVTVGRPYFLPNFFLPEKCWFWRCEDSAQWQQYVFIDYFCNLKCQFSACSDTCSEEEKSNHKVHFCFIFSEITMFYHAHPNLSPLIVLRLVVTNYSGIILYLKYWRVRLSKIKVNSICIAKHMVQHDSKTVHFKVEQF